MAKDSNADFSTADLEKLQHLSNLLHLFHHRNKNQHRRSIWWRHFSTFRRQLNSLVAEVENLHEVPNTHLQRAKKKIQDRQTDDRVSKRLEFWAGVVVQKWYTSFSQIVADGRFTVLGLTLIAVLAQTCQITGIIFSFDETEVAAGEEAMEDLIKGSDERAVESSEMWIAGEEDWGEVVDRKEGNEAMHDTTQARETTSQRKLEPAKINKPRRRKQKDNAIDDLFSSLN